MRNPLWQSEHQFETVLRKVRIFPRLFAIMLFIVIAPTCLITFYNFNAYVDKIQTETQNYISLLVSNVTVQINDRLQGYESIASFVASDKTMLQCIAENEAIAAENPDYLQDPGYRANKELLEHRLYDIGGNDLNILNLQFITAKDQYAMKDYTGAPRGACIKSIPGFLQSELYRTTLDAKGYACWFDTTQAGSLIYKFPYSRRGISSTVTMVAAVYTLDTRQLLGVLMCNLDKRFLTSALTSYGFYGVGNTFLLGQNGVIATLNPNINAPSFGYDKETQASILGNTSGSFLQNVAGKQVYVSFKKAQGLELYIAHMVDMDYTLQPAYAIRNTGLLLVGLLVLVCVFIASITTNSIAAPLNRLVRRMQGFGKELSVPCVPLQGHDELTQVEARFLEMAENTQKLVGEIIQAKLREKTLELSKTNAELNALQMQINPHFLYNTMDLIRWETMRLGSGENEASRMIDAFCRLLRATIKKDREMVPVADELEHASVYVQVVNFRKEQKINLICALDFDTRAYLLPKLTLQPLIENSVAHGFTQKTPNPTIHIRGWRIQDTLLITVTDNGKGMPPQALKALQQSLQGSEVMRDSIGLRNVNQRLKLCFGSEYGVTLESVEQMGTEITIRLPVVSHPQSNREDPDA